MNDLDRWLFDPERIGFLEHLEKKPNDFLHRSIFADALEDAGFWGAGQGMRWLAEHGKYPRALREGMLDNGGWYRGISNETINNLTNKDHPVYPHTLPSVFIEKYVPPIDENDTGGNLWRRSARNGTKYNERDFLHAANQLDWDKNGEPVKSKKE